MPVVESDCYLFQSTNAPSTQAIVHCGNFPNSFLITICFRGVIIPAFLQEVKPRILPRIRRNFERKTPNIIRGI
ncbi:hypothetical protein [Nostoc sp.]|uniref:hypothetical protein n=1 Tax=Nostoc sp. TaxID=1180 RepID=UPI002FFC5DC0